MSVMVPEASVLAKVVVTDKLLGGSPPLASAAATRRIGKKMKIRSLMVHLVEVFVSLSLSHQRSHFISDRNGQNISEGWDRPEGETLEQAGKASSGFG